MNFLAHFTSKLLLLACLSLALTGCDKNSDESERSLSDKPNETLPLTSAPPIRIEPLKSISAIYLLAAQQSFESLLLSAEALSRETEALTLQPTAEHLKKGLAAWKQAHDLYSATEVFRHIELVYSEFDHSQNSPEVIHPIEIRLDQYPIIPGYLDAVARYPTSGLVHSEQAITKETLNNEHQFSDKGYVAMGFHALEFLLIGDPSLKQEPSVRFANKNGQSTASSVAMRRSAYALLLAEMIEEDINRLYHEWTSNDGYYKQNLLQASGDRGDSLILSALLLEKNKLSVNSKNAHSSAIEMRATQLSSLIDSIANSGVTLPGKLLEIIEPEEPEQIKP